MHSRRTRSGHTRRVFVDPGCSILPSPSTVLIARSAMRQKMKISANSLAWLILLGVALRAGLAASLVASVRRRRRQLLKLPHLLLSLRCLPLFAIQTCQTEVSLGCKRSFLFNTQQADPGFL